MRTKLNMACVRTTLRMTAGLAALTAGAVAAQVPLPLTGREGVKVSTAAGPPPTGLVAKRTPSSISLTWNCPREATGYDVYATPKGGAPIKVTPAPVSPQCILDVSRSMNYDPRLPAPTESAYTTGFSHVGLTAAAEFTYVVRALYPSGFADSESLTAQTSVWPAPTGLVAIPSGLNVDLTWNAVSGPTGYAVIRESSTGARMALTPYGCQTQTVFRDLAVVPGTYSYHIQSCPNSAIAVVPVRVGTAGYDMAVVSLDPKPGTSQFGSTWSVNLRNEGDREVQQAGVECTVGPFKLRSLSGGSAYPPGRESSFVVFLDEGIERMYYVLGPGNHGGTCAVNIVQPNGVQDADPADNAKAVTWSFPPAKPPDLRMLGISREDCSGSFARQARISGDLCILLNYRFDNETGPTFLDTPWTIECSVGSVTQRLAKTAKLVTLTNHTGGFQVMAFSGPELAKSASRPVTCRLDPDGQIAESNESNNVMTITLVLP